MQHPRSLVILLAVAVALATAAAASASPRDSAPTAGPIALFATVGNGPSGKIVVAGAIGDGAAPSASTGTASPTSTATSSRSR